MDDILNNPSVLIYFTKFFTDNDFIYFIETKNISRFFVTVNGINYRIGSFLTDVHNRIINNERAIRKMVNKDALNSILVNYATKDYVDKRYVDLSSRIKSNLDMINRNKVRIDEIFNRVARDEKKISDLYNSYNNLLSKVRSLAKSIQNNINVIKQNKQAIDELSRRYDILSEYINSVKSLKISADLGNIRTNIDNIGNVLNKQFTDIKNAYDSIHMQFMSNINTSVSAIKSQFKKLEAINFDMSINYYSLFNMLKLENALNNINIPDFSYTPNINNVYDFMGLMSISKSNVTVKVVDVAWSMTFSKTAVVNPGFWLYNYLANVLYNRINEAIKAMQKSPPDLMLIVKSLWLALVTQKAMSDVIMHTNAGYTKFEKTYYCPIDNRVYVYVYADNLRFIYPGIRDVNVIKSTVNGLNAKINNIVTSNIKKLRDTVKIIPDSMPTNAEIRKTISTGVNSSDIPDVYMKIDINKNPMKIEDIAKYISDLEDRISKLEEKLKKVSL